VPIVAGTRGRARARGRRRGRGPGLERLPRRAHGVLQNDRDRRVRVASTGRGVAAPRVWSLGVRARRVRRR
jgi:hypothetical protein